MLMFGGCIELQICCEKWQKDANALDARHLPSSRLRSHIHVPGESLLLSCLPSRIIPTFVGTANQLTRNHSDQRQVMMRQSVGTQLTRNRCHPDFSRGSLTYINPFTYVKHIPFKNWLGFNKTHRHHLALPSSYTLYFLSFPTSLNVSYPCGILIIIISMTTTIIL